MKSIFQKLALAVVALFTGLGERLHELLFKHMSKTGLMLAVRDWPTSANLAQHRVTNPMQSETVRQRLYDHLLYPTAGQTQLSFFSTALGQGLTTALGGGVGTPKTLWDTNLELPSTLPSGKAFFIESIEVVFYPGSVSTANTYTPATVTFFAAVAAATVGGSVNDVNTFYQSGMLEFQVLDKVYLRETPLMAFPPKAFFDLSAAVGNNSATTSEVGMAVNKAGGRPYYLQPEITLEPAQNFSVNLKWPAAVATPSGFNARVGVILDGYTIRASQ